MDVFSRRGNCLTHKPNLELDPGFAADVSSVLCLGKYSSKTRSAIGSVLEYSVIKVRADASALFVELEENYAR